MNLPTLISRARAGDASVLGALADAAEAMSANSASDLARKLSDYRLTPRQLEVAECIAAYLDGHGYSPTYDEIADKMGVSKGSIVDHLEELIRKKVLVCEKHKSRSLRFATGILITRWAAGGEEFR